tara:strand:+ start:637 stop:810 length:174 start_codon:yes stop_codon:yes gene_type:complete
LISKIIEYEDGMLDDDQVIELFQDLVDNGMAWSLQGSYGRMAAYLIDEGLVYCRKAI